MSTQGQLVVRPRHRRGWESQPGRPGHDAGRPRVRPRHRRGWESQRPLGGGVAAASVPCVLVTDGDGSLNVGSACCCGSSWPCVLVTDGDGSLNSDPLLLDATQLGGASSSPTGMGVSTAIRCCWTPPSSAVRPRHRRGWESQPCTAPRSMSTGRGCVLVTDGDGSLNNLKINGQIAAVTGCVLVTDGDGSLNAVVCA